MKSTSAARSACRCALSIRKPAPSWKTPAHPAKNAHAVIVRTVDPVVTVVAADAAKAVATVDPVVMVAVAVIAVHAQSVAKAETKAAATPTTFLHS